MSITAASPPIAGSPGDLWYDSGNGNRRNECVASVSWNATTGWAGWGATAASAAAAPVWPDSGSALLVTASGSGDWLVTSPVQACNPGDVVGAQVSVFVPAALDAPQPLNDASAGIAWYGSGGALLSVTSGTVGTAPVGAVTALTATGTAPAGAASFAIQAGDAETPPAGAQMALGTATCGRWVPHEAATGSISLPLPGAVDGTTVTGAVHLNYSSSPGAAGTLISSVADSPGTDQYGNAYLAGVCNYTPVAGQPWQAVQVYEGSARFCTATTYAGPWAEQAEIEFDSAGNLHLAGGGSGNQQLVVGPQAGPSITPGAVLTVPLYAQEPGGATGHAETWHSLTPGNGWTGSFSYKLTPENEVAISCNLTAPSSSPNGVTIVTLPSGYTLATGPKVIPVAASASTSTVAPYFTIGTGGNVQAQGVAASAVTVGANAKIPLDL